MDNGNNQNVLPTAAPVSAPVTSDTPNTVPTVAAPSVVPPQAPAVMPVGQPQIITAQTGTPAPIQPNVAQNVMQQTPPAPATGGTSYQHQYNQGGDFKKQLEDIAVSYRKGGVESEPIPRSEKPVEAMEEIPANPEIEKKPELAGYVEKVEREPETIKPIVDDYTQQILLKPVGANAGKVKLPLTEDEVQLGLHHKVWESVRWLAEWCVRQVKMLGGRAEYKSKTE